jgi:hypothetical protein
LRTGAFPLRADRCATNVASVIDPIESKTRIDK